MSGDILVLGDVYRRAAMSSCPICGSPLPRPGLRRCTCGALLHVKRDGTVEQQEGELTEEAKFALSGLLAARWMAVAHKEMA